MTNEFHDNPTRPADDAESGDSLRASAGIDHTDLLISRIIDGEASARDWSALEKAAAADATIWRDLAGAQREHALLAGRVRAETSRALAVEAEGGPGPFPIARIGRNPWSGWLVAAALALAAALGWLRPQVSPPMTTPVQPAGYTVNSPEEAWQAYLALGHQDERVLGEMPGRVLLDTRPLDGGERFEVMYIRRIVERTEVNDLMRFTGEEDETGRPVGVPVSFQPAAFEREQPWRW